MARVMATLGGDARLEFEPLPDQRDGYAGFAMRVVVNGEVEYERRFPAKTAHFLRFAADHIDKALA